MRPRIYIAGPISRGDLAANIKQATDAARQLIAAGYAPFCPQLTCYLGGDTPTVSGGVSHDEWMEVDLPWVSVADAVLRLPGESTGADMETDLADSLGIPVFHSVDDIAASMALAEAEERTPMLVLRRRAAPAARGDARFLQYLDELRALHLSKGHDYADADDPLRNYVISGNDNGIEPWRSAQTRLSEKYHRLVNLTRKAADPKHESIKDNLLDIAAIALIVLSLRDRETHRKVWDGEPATAALSLP